MNFVPKDFRVKHQLLQLLNSHTNKDDTYDIKMSQIADSFKMYDEKFLYDQLYVLDENKDIKILRSSEDQKFMITRQGVKSFIDKVYLKVGKKETLDRYYDYGKNVAVWFAAASLFLSLWREYSTKANMLELENKILKMDLKLNTLVSQSQNQSQVNNQMTHTPKQKQQPKAPKASIK